MSFTVLYIYIYPSVIHTVNEPGSSVGIATDYGLDGPGIESRWGEIFCPSRPALGPTQPPVTMGTGSFPGVKYSQGMLLTTHPLLVLRSWKIRAIPLPTLWATTGPVTGLLCLNLFNTHSHSFSLFLGGYLKNSQHNATAGCVVYTCML